MNGAGRFRGDMAGDPLRPGELPEQPLYSVAILLEVRIDLRVSAFEIRMSDETWAAMTGANHVHHVQVVSLNQPVQMRVYEVEAGRGAPMSQQAWLDVFFRERPLEQRIIPQIDLPYRQVVGGKPIFVKLCDLFGSE